MRPFFLTREHPPLLLLPPTRNAQLPPEELYQAFNRAIESVNVVVATYSDEAMGDLQVSPEAGTIAFGSGLHQWAFTLSRFAKIYAE